MPSEIDQKSIEESVQDILVAMKQPDKKRTFSKIESNGAAPKKQLVKKNSVNKSNLVSIKKQKVDLKEAIIPPMFRNSYQLFNLCLPVSLGDKLLYINEPVEKIQTTEKYFVLRIQLHRVLPDGSLQTVEQCDLCKAEFARKNYFKQHPEFTGRALIVKNKYQLEGKSIQVFAKVMCCCLHKDCDKFRFSVDFSSDDKKQTYSTSFDALVKQWKKGCTKVLPVTVYLE